MANLKSWKGKLGGTTWTLENILNTCNSSLGENDTICLALKNIQSTSVESCTTDNDDDFDYDDLKTCCKKPSLNSNKICRALNVKDEYSNMITLFRNTQ